MISLPDQIEPSLGAAQIVVDEVLRVADSPALTALIADAATRAGSLWAAHRGLR